MSIYALGSRTAAVDRPEAYVSIAVGGADLRTAYLGELLGDRTPLVGLPVAGFPMVHWEWR